jgi:hypothetical protein
MTLEWIECPESSNITRFGHDGENRVLHVEFHSGSVYKYFDVPEPIFEQMKTSGSRGQFLAQNIKGSYRYARE